MKPKWISQSGHYNKCKNDFIILRFNWIQNRMLVASKGWIVIKPLFIIWEWLIGKYYKTVRRILRFAERKGYIEIDYGEVFVWETIKKWRMSAIKNKIRNK